MAETGSRVVTPALIKVEVAGTAVQIKTPGLAGITEGQNTSLRTIVVQALPTNTTEIAVGDKNVKAKKGTQAAPERRGIGLSPNSSISVQVNDGTQLFVDSETNKDGCVVMELLS